MRLVPRIFGSFVRSFVRLGFFDFPENWNTNSTTSDPIQFFTGANIENTADLLASQRRRCFSSYRCRNCFSHPPPPPPPPPRAGKLAVETSSLRAQRSRNSYYRSSYFPCWRFLLFFPVSIDTGVCVTFQLARHLASPSRLSHLSACLNYAASNAARCSPSTDFRFDD